MTFHNGDKTTQFVFLTKRLADKTWMLDNKLIFNADFVLPNGAAAVERNTEIAYFDMEHKFSTKYCIVKNNKDYIKPQVIENFDIDFCSPEIDLHYDYSNWQKIGEKTDSLSCELYNEFIWYKGQIPDYLKEITLSARH